MTDGFYTGIVAQRIIDAVATTPVNPAVMTLEDFTSYWTAECPTVYVDYRQWEVCGMVPPNSGGVTVALILLLLEGVDLAAVEL